MTASRRHRVILRKVGVPVDSSPTELVKLLEEMRPSLQQELLRILLESPAQVVLGNCDSYGPGQLERIYLTVRGNNKRVYFHQISGAANGLSVLFSKKGYPWRVWASCKVPHASSAGILSMAVGLVDVRKTSEEMARRA